MTWNTTMPHRANEWLSALGVDARGGTARRASDERDVCDGCVDARARTTEGWNVGHRKGVGVDRGARSAPSERGGTANAVSTRSRGWIASTAFTATRADGGGGEGCARVI